MLSYLEALEALGETGTMGKAGTRLRLSQSAVSKRIAALEAQLGEPLVAKDGRGVVLTPRAERLLARLRPITGDLRAALADEHAGARGHVTIGVSESILGTWGPELLGAARDACPGVTLALHAHRSPAVIERVAQGEYMVGLVAGAGGAAGLTVTPLLREPMAVLRAADAAKGPLLSIETRSGTWDAIARRAGKAGLKPEVVLESYFAVAALARAGFGDGLVPLGVALAAPPGTRSHVKRVVGLARPVSLVARPSVAARPQVQAVLQALQEAAPGVTKRWR